MKLYRCDLCGRIFHERIPHICIHGNYRKRHLTFTEFEDVDNEYVKKSEVDVKEKIFPRYTAGALILNEPLKSKIEYMVNWEHRRYEIAKDIYCLMIDWLRQKDGAIAIDALDDNRAARNAIYFADALIAELKKEKNEQP